MKKILLLLITALFIVSVSSVFVSAEEINPDGFKFNIDKINASIAGEDGMIITKQEAIEKANLKWPIVIVCEKVSDNVYKAKSDAIKPTGTAPSLTLNANEIIIAIHSNTSDIAQKDQYKNVEQKVAAMNVKAGMYFKLEGIDVAAGTVTNGTATCSTKKPDGTATTSSAAASSAAASSAAASSSAATSSAAASSAAASSATASSAAASSATASSKVESSGVTSEIGTDNTMSKTTIIIIIAAAVVVVIAVVAVILMKKKK
jgi:hypothetical protein